MAQYWIYINGRIQGPYKPKHLSEIDGFNPQVLACPDGAEGKDEEWKSAWEFEEIKKVIQTSGQSSIHKSEPTQKSIEIKGTQSPPQEKTLPESADSSPKKSNQSSEEIKNADEENNPVTKEEDSQQKPIHSYEPPEPSISFPTPPDIIKEEIPQEYVKEDLSTLLEQGEKKSKTMNLFNPLHALLYIALIGTLCFGFVKYKNYAMVKMIQIEKNSIKSSKLSKSLISKVTDQKESKNALEIIHKIKSPWTYGKDLKEYLSSDPEEGKWITTKMGNGYWVVYETIDHNLDAQVGFWINLIGEFLEADTPRARYLLSGQDTDHVKLSFDELTQMAQPKKPAIKKKKVARKKVKPRKKAAKPPLKEPKVVSPPITAEPQKTPAPDEKVPQKSDENFPESAKTEEKNLENTTIKENETLEEEIVIIPEESPTQMEEKPVPQEKEAEEIAISEESKPEGSKISEEKSAEELILKWLPEPEGKESIPKETPPQDPSPEFSD